MAKWSMAEFRRQKKMAGFVESAVWLSPEDRDVVEHQVKITGQTKAEIIRQAIRLAYAENQVQTQG